MRPGLTRSALALLAGAVTAASARTSAAQADASPPTIAFQPCDAYPRGRDLILYARFDDASDVFEPKLVYRGRGEQNWQSVPFVREVGATAWSARVATQELKSPIEYFIEVFDVHGNGPARRGSPEAPLLTKSARKADACPKPAEAAVMPVVSAAAEAAPGPTEPISPELQSALTPPTLLVGASPPPAPRDTCAVRDAPLYCSGWFWLITASVVAAAGTTAVMLLRGGEDDASYPRVVDLIVTAPGPGSALTSPRPP